jgi:hypothetical protein
MHFVALKSCIATNMGHIGLVGLKTNSNRVEIERPLWTLSDPGDRNELCRIREFRAEILNCGCL